MDLRGLRAFVAVVEEGSFTAAARRLRVAQPALSQQARRLEEEMGCRLLERLPRGVVPTPEGLRLLVHARDLLARAAAARDELRGGAEAPMGEVALGLPQSTAALLTVPLLAAAMTELPGVRLRIIESMTGYIPGWLREGRIDLGMIFRAETGQGLLLHQLLEEGLLLVGPTLPAAGSPYPAAPHPGAEEIGEVPFTELASLPMILPGVPHGMRELIDQRARRCGLRLRVVAEVDALAQLPAAVAAGLGWSILSFTTIRDAVRAGQVRAWRIREPAITRPVILARASDRPGTRAGRAVEALLRRVVVETVKGGGWPAALTEEAGREHPGRPPLPA